MKIEFLAGAHISRICRAWNVEKEVDTWSAGQELTDEEYKKVKQRERIWKASARARVFGKWLDKAELL